MKSKSSPVPVSVSIDWGDQKDLESNKYSSRVNAGDEEVRRQSEDSPPIGLGRVHCKENLKQQAPQLVAGGTNTELSMKIDRPKRIRKPSRKLDMASQRCTANSSSPIKNRNNNNNNNSISEVNIDDLKLEDVNFYDDENEPKQSATPELRGERCELGGERVLMRSWLKLKADAAEPNGMRWHNQQRTQIRIPWKHGSRAGWTVNDCRVFKAWAEHTG